jgi:hypothetical protein
MNTAMLNALELGEEIIEAVKIRIESSDATRGADLSTVEVLDWLEVIRKYEKKMFVKAEKMIREML